jgi:hypothetical protein
MKQITDWTGQNNQSVNPANPLFSHRQYSIIIPLANEQDGMG